MKKLSFFFTLFIMPCVLHAADNQSIAKIEKLPQLIHDETDSKITKQDLYSITSFRDSLWRIIADYSIDSVNMNINTLLREAGLNNQIAGENIKIVGLSKPCYCGCLALKIHSDEAQGFLIVGKPWINIDKKTDYSRREHRSEEEEELDVVAVSKAGSYTATVPDWKKGEGGSTLCIESYPLKTLYASEIADNGDSKKTTSGSSIDT